MVLVGHPFDLLKVRLQAKSEATLFGELGKIFKSGHTLRSLYQGVTPPLLGVMPVFALYYGSYKVIKQGDERKLVHASLGSAFLTTLVSCPAERLKVLMQTNGDAKMLPLARNVWRHGGFRALYSGFGIMLAKDLPGSLVYFGIYEHLRSHSIIMAGGLAGILSWLATAPMDTLKSIRQSQLEPRGSLKQLVREVYKQAGLSGFWRGIVPSLVKAFPSNAACFGTIELIHHVLR